MRLLVLAACTALALSACKRTEAPVPPAAPAAATEPAPVAATVAANDNLNAVAWVQTSVEYRAISEQTYRAAAEQLDRALKEKHWDALVPDERGNAATGLKPAVVLDVDETVLDNSPYQARLIRDEAEYDEVTWDQWVAEKKAKPLPGVVDFAKAANAKGVTLVYISNRAVHLKEAPWPTCAQWACRLPMTACSWDWVRWSKAASSMAAKRTAAANWPGRSTAC